MRTHNALWLLALGLVFYSAAGGALAAGPSDSAVPSKPVIAPVPAAAPDSGKPVTAGAAPVAAETGAKPLSPAEADFQKGREALFQGKYVAAIGLLEKAVAADKTKTSYRLNLARAYRYAGKDDQAIAQLEAIIKASPDHVEAGQALGELYGAAKRWADVVKVLDPLLQYRHDYPTYHMLADAYNNLGNREKARKAYEEALTFNPQSASDQYQLGNIYLAGNCFALAARSYEAALRLGLDSPVLRYKLGSAYFNLRNYFGNISVQTIKSGKIGSIHGAWYVIEPVAGQKDVFRCAPETSAVYQIARALADGIEDRPDIHVLRATIYLNAHRYAQACELFTQIEPVVKDDKALFYYYYAQAAFGTGQYDRYLVLLEKAIELDPAAYKASRVDAYLAVADQYNQAGDLDKYIDYLVKAVNESPQTASLHLKLGYAYEEVRKFDQAVAQWRLVLDLEPDHPQRIKLLNLVEKYTSSARMVVVPPKEKQPKETPKSGPEKNPDLPKSPAAPAARK